MKPAAVSSSLRIGGKERMSHEGRETASARTRKRQSGELQGTSGHHGQRQGPRADLCLCSSGMCVIEHAHVEYALIRTRRVYSTLSAWAFQHRALSTHRDAKLKRQLSLDASLEGESQPSIMTSHNPPRSASRRTMHCGRRSRWAFDL